MVENPIYAMAISPHPFDNELGIAGTVARWTREGKETIFLHYPDLGVEYTPEFRNELLKLVLEYRPEVVSTCDPFYRLRGYISNPDHRATGQAVLDTVWPYALTPNTFRNLYDLGYRPHNVKEVLLWGGEQPNVTYDISDTYDLKVKAFSCNKSQTGVPPRPQFLDRMLQRATESAKGQNFKLGESFHRLEALQSL
jgi:LmbE family N-acetylglucosaminyl deacetylase